MNRQRANGVQKVFLPTRNVYQTDQFRFRRVQLQTMCSKRQGQITDALHTCHQYTSKYNTTNRTSGVWAYTVYYADTAAAAGGGYLPYCLQVEFIIKRQLLHPNLDSSISIASLPLASRSITGHDTCSNIPVFRRVGQSQLGLLISLLFINHQYRMTDTFAIVIMFIRLFSSFL